MRSNYVHATLAAIAFAASGAIVLADAHISVGPSGTGSRSVSIETSSRGDTPSLSMSVSNGERRIDIDTGRVGPEAGAGAASEALDGLDDLSVNSTIERRSGVEPCSIRNTSGTCQ